MVTKISQKQKSVERKKGQNKDDLLLYKNCSLIGIEKLLVKEFLNTINFDSIENQMSKFGKCEMVTPD